MRITVVMLQLTLLLAAYLMISVPLLAAAGGLTYLTATAAEAVLFTGGFLLAEPLFSWLQTVLPSIGGGGAAAAGGSLVTAVLSAAGTAFTAAVWSAVPLMLTALTTLFCALLAPYCGWGRRARKWGGITLAVCQWLYMLPQFIVISAGMWMIFLALEGGDISAAVQWAVILVGMFLVCNSYFIISRLLLRRMPERADTALTLKRLPAAQASVWAFFALFGASVIWLAERSLGSRSILYIGTAVIVFSAVPFALNILAVRRAAAGRGKLPVFLLLAADILLTLVFLFILPPLGAAFFLSTALTAFLLEALLESRPGEPQSGSDGTPNPVS